MARYCAHTLGFETAAKNREGTNSGEERGAEKGACFSFLLPFPAPEVFFFLFFKKSALLGETDGLFIYLFIYLCPHSPNCSIFLAAEGIQFRLPRLAPWCNRKYKLQIQLIVFQKGGFFFFPLNMNPNGWERYVQV